MPLLAALKEAVVKRKFRRIAIVGVPCVVQAAARIRESENDLLVPYGKAIRLVIGLFCTETFDYSALVDGKLKDEYKIEPYEIQRFDVKGKLVITKVDGSIQNIPLAELERCIRSGCKVCADLTSICADISAGSIESPAGSTTLLIRTQTGTGFVERATKNKKLSVAHDADAAAIEKLAKAKIKKNPRK